MGKGPPEFQPHELQNRPRSFDPHRPLCASHSWCAELLLTTHGLENDTCTVDGIHYMSRTQSIVNNTILSNQLDLCTVLRDIRTDLPVNNIQHVILCRVWGVTHAASLRDCYKDFGWFNLIDLWMLSRDLHTVYICMFDSALGLYKP